MIKGVIHHLPPSVIELISAGEVIHRPANAVKELIENSIDSGATNISVVIKGGGLQLIQVKDNGCGIPLESLDIVCERHTTSKLTAFEDLKAIKTLGFRGEALASISYISFSEAFSFPNAYFFRILEGTLVEKPKAIAANVGTQITVENLFYNAPLRSATIRNATEECNRIRDIVTKYAVHFPKLAFLMKRYDGSGVDLRTEGNTSTCLSNIRLLYGVEVARELKEFDFEDTRYGFKAYGLLSNPTFSYKKLEFILFINDRLVDCLSIKKIVEWTYEKFASRRIHPFVYLRIDVLPSQIDVNVHPTKQEVSFLYESDIVACIQKTIEDTFVSFGGSRTFFTSVVHPEGNKSLSGIKKQTSTDELSQVLVSKSQNPCKKIRTDERERKLSEFFDRPHLPESQISLNFPQSQKTLSPSQTIQEENLEKSAMDTNIMFLQSCRKHFTKPDWRKIQLSSVLELQQEICGRVSAHLRSIFRGMKFVGCVDPRYTLFQYDTGLYMINIEKISEELFYQVLIFGFGNFNVYQLSEPCSIAELVALGFKVRDPLSNVTADSQQVVDISNFLMKKSEMLWDYFSLQLKDGKLLALPNLLDNYVVQLEGLAEFILQLASDVNWTMEKACFESFCRVASKFFAFKKRFCDGDHVGDDLTVHWSWVIENVICKAAKHRLLPPDDWVRQQVVIKLADLETLYKVFERC
ncbi:unnamed protein product [Soboliphyme baturini]|uniref:DNA_mis_repair domain-containing protein n=1 Tax=Soboliphyme baturini TaxID=241478 RepID=A0A183IHD6_9BILA|nr:unnamed protein product [Soboliphyme baturini]